MKMWKLLLSLVLAWSVSAHAEETIITGQIMVKESNPMAHGTVLLYNKAFGSPPHPYRYWRIPDMIIGTDNDGKFAVEVQPGTYYLMAAYKNPDGEIGPPKQSEFLYFHQNAQGNARPIEVQEGHATNLGVLLGGETWLPSLVERDKGITAVEGTITDHDGKPVENAIVFAYINSQAVGRPAFVSDRTDGTGRYNLRVAEGGTYYLKVRSVIGGGAPESGEFTNVSREFVPTSVNLETGKKIKGETLKVERFAGKGSTGSPKPEKVWKKLNELQSQ